jgi:hypothetical protein
LVFWWDDFCSCLSHCWHFRYCSSNQSCYLISYE